MANKKKKLQQNANILKENQQLENKNNQTVQESQQSRKQNVINKVYNNKGNNNEQNNNAKNINNNALRNTNISNRVMNNANNILNNSTANKFSEFGKKASNKLNIAGNVFSKAQKLLGSSNKKDSAISETVSDLFAGTGNIAKDVKNTVSNNNKLNKRATKIGTQETSVNPNVTNKIYRSQQISKILQQKEQEQQNQSQNIEVKYTDNQKIKGNVGTGIRSTAKTSMLPVSKQNQTKVEKYVHNEDVKDISNLGYFSKGAFSDGFKASDIPKTVLGTATDIAQNLAKGTMSIGESAGDIITLGRAYLAEKAGRTERSKELKSNAEENAVEAFFNGNFDTGNKATNVISKGLEKTTKFSNKNSISGDKLDEIEQSLGYMAGMTALQSVGVPWQATAGITSGGQEAVNASKQGATWGEILTSSAISAGTEIGSEYIFGGVKLPGTGKAVDKIIEGSLEEIEETWVKALAKHGIDMAGEGLEEWISNVGSAIGRGITYKKTDNSIEGRAKGIVNELKDEDWVNSFIAGSLSAGILGAPGLVTNIKSNQSTSQNQIQNIIKNSTLSDNEKSSLYDFAIRNNVETNVLKNMINNYQAEKNNQTASDILQETNQEDERINTITNSNLTQEEKNELAELIKDSDVTNEDIEKIILDYQQKQGTELQNNEVLNNNQQVIQQESKMAQNGNMEQIKQNQEIFQKSAQKYDIDTENNTVKQIKELADKTNNILEFSDDFENDRVLAKYDNGKITINAKNKDHNKTLQNLAIHEAIHSKSGSEGFDKLVKIVLDYAKSKGEYETARRDLENIYKDKYKTLTAEEFNKLMDEEVVTNTLGEYFGTEEKLNEILSNINESDRRTTIEKFIDLVKDIVNRLTGYKDQQQYFKKVQRQLESVLSNDYTATGDKNMIMGKKGLNNISDKDIRRSGMESYKKAQRMAKDKISNKKIFEETGWFKDKVTGKMKFNFSDKDMELIDRNYSKGQEYKLKDIIKHDTLFEIYPQLKDYTVKIKNLEEETGNKLNGRYNSLTNELEIDVNRFNDKANVEGTLIHEIQHAIQKIEKFANGTSTKFGKDNYKKNPGEIEARDTAKRFMLEKYKNKDLTNKLPKSANIEANILEKMKIGLYNYITNISEEVNNDETSTNNQVENEPVKTTAKEKNNRLVLGGIENSEKGSFSMSKEKQNRLQELKSIDTSNMRFLERSKINQEIRAIENGFDTVEEYMEAEKEKRENALKEAEKEREERRKKIAEQEKEHEGYQMSHRPTESGAYASDISANGWVPKDVYDHPDWYFDMNRDSSKESFNIIKKIKGNPEAEITIYRATPSNTINKGDWVTLSKKYAEEHNERTLDGKGNIVELKVKARDVQYAGDDINEFGYFPQEDNSKYAYQSNGAWQSFVDKYFKGEGTGKTLNQVKLPEMPIENYKQVLNTMENIPQEEKNSMLKEVEGMKKNKQSLDEFRQFAEELNKSYAEYNKEKNDNILNTNMTYNTGRKEIYQKYMKSNAEYDRSSVEGAKEIIRANNQGRRTKEQWLQIAKQIGTEIANKSNSDIEEIAYRTWQDERPSSKDSLNRQGKKFVQFNSDEWINTIYDTVKETREMYSIDTSNQENAFNGYTEKEIKNIQSKKISIAKNIEDISEFVNKSRKMPGNFKMYLGKIKENTSKFIKDTIGINVDNYNISLKTDDVRKIFKDHGSEKTEIPRGQLPITENDFLNIPDIINNPDEISRAGMTQQGKPVIRFEKNIGGNNIIITYVSDKHNNLEIQTMYKFKNNKKRDSATALHENKTPGLHTSEMDSGTNLINNIIPQNEKNNNSLEKNSQNSNKSSFLLPKKQEGKLPEKEKIVDNVYKEEINEGKTRKHYQSIYESDQIGKVGKDIAKELYKKDTYTPVSNINTISQANENIKRNGVERTYESFMNKMGTNERVTLQDIATGERLIQIYSQNGEYGKVNDLIQNVAILGTELGQQVQALSLIKKASPEGQLQYLNKIVDRTNIKENTNLKVTDEMSKKILESKNQDELQQNVSEVTEQLANELPITMKDKIRSWRYLSMLGNPRTHIRNLGANVVMNVTQNVKNGVAGAGEDLASIFNEEFERTKTLKRSNKDQKTFAKNDAEIMQDLIDGGGKFDIQNVIQSNKRSFDNKVLNKIAKFNTNMLDIEDKIFLKTAYRQALQNYMTANNLSSKDMTGQILQKAREYASLQAQEATFHQFSSLANTISSIENKGGIAGKTIEAVLPFKKTPINIAKTGVEYSPIGLAQSIGGTIKDIAQTNKDYKAKLDSGKITEVEYKTATSKLITNRIDQMAKGLTGTSIALIGYALAKSGVLRAGNDDEKDEFEKELGNQEYSIKLGDNTYTLDWLSPSAIPLFTGATVYNLLNGKGDKEDKKVLNSLATGFAKAFEPMTEMSMLQGLTSAISSYESDSSNMLFDLSASMASSYAGQFVPTALGQLTKTIDPTVRDTTSTKTGLEKKVDQFKRQQMAKLPGLSKKLPAKQNIWGEDKTRADNIIQRYVENALLPYNREKIQKDITDAKLEEVFDKTGDSKVLPSRPEKYITIDGVKTTLTSEEYAMAKKEFGSTSKTMLDKLIKSEQYKEMSNEEKAEAIQDVYSYAKEQLKVDFTKNYISDKKDYNTMKALKEDSADYISYSVSTKDLEQTSEKIDYLKNMKISDTSKDIIYENSLGSQDDNYSNLKLLGMSNINAYLDYKLQNFEADKDANGDSISGTKKKKVANYISNSNFSPVEKEYLFVQAGYASSLNSSQKAEFRDAIQNSKLDDETKQKILKKLK